MRGMPRVSPRLKIVEGCFCCLWNCFCYWQRLYVLESLHHADYSYFEQQLEYRQCWYDVIKSLLPWEVRRDLDNHLKRAFVLYVRRNEFAARDTTPDHHIIKICCGIDPILLGGYLLSIQSLKIVTSTSHFTWACVFRKGFSNVHFTLYRDMWINWDFPNLKNQRRKIKGGKKV